MASESSGRIILDLCGGTGAWSRPYAEAGYDVRIVTLPKQDVRSYEPPPDVHGVLAAPPCTEFAASGARWWAKKSPVLLEEAMDIVKACWRIILSTNPAWWALENPVGRLDRLASFLGGVEYTFQPWEYGDPWMKRSCIWGEHNQPTRSPVEIAAIVGSGFKARGGIYKNRHTVVNAVSNSRHNNPGQFIHQLVKAGNLRADWVHRLGPSPDRAMLRSITSPGFARAFFEANP